MEKIYDMLVIGGGPGGYTTALYAARAGLQVLVLERLYSGGQMTQTHQIDNYPGFPQGIDGVTLGMNMQQQAQAFGAETQYATVNTVELTSDPKIVHTTQGDFRGRTLVIAAGADPRPLDVAGTEKYLRQGIHYCAACDGNFYRGKTVAVIGGGNSAAGDALLLSRIAKQVILVHRRDQLRATKLYHQALMQAENLRIQWNSRVSGILEKDGFAGLLLQNVHTLAQTPLPCDAVFVSIGRQPATDFLQGQLSLDSQGYIIANESTCTSIPGVFAVGDVRTKQVRQVVTAVADGAVAAHQAQEFLIAT